MFDLYHDYDPVTPAGGMLLAVISIDLADKLARRCPDRKVPENRSWRKAEEELTEKGLEREVPVPPFSNPSS